MIENLNNKQEEVLKDLKFFIREVALIKQIPLNEDTSINYSNWYSSNGIVQILELQIEAQKRWYKHQLIESNKDIKYWKREALQAHQDKKVYSDQVCKYYTIEEEQNKQIELLKIGQAGFEHNFQESQKKNIQLRETIDNLRKENKSFIKKGYLYERHLYEQITFIGKHLNPNDPPVVCYIKEVETPEPVKDMEYYLTYIAECSGYKTWDDLLADNNEKEISLFYDDAKKLFDNNG